MFLIMLEWIRKHKIFSVMSGFGGVLTLFITIYLTHFSVEEPVKELKTNLSQQVIAIRLKIINIAEGCKEKNDTYTEILKKENEDRIENLDKLIAMTAATSDSLKKALGTDAWAQITCFIKYNDSLSQRKNICDGKFFTEDEMKNWESRIIGSIRKKTDNNADCSW